MIFSMLRLRLLHISVPLTISKSHQKKKKRRFRFSRVLRTTAGNAPHCSSFTQDLPADSTRHFAILKDVPRKCVCLLPIDPPTPFRSGRPAALWTKLPPSDFQLQFPQSPSPLLQIGCLYRRIFEMETQWLGVIGRLSFSEQIHI